MAYVWGGMQKVSYEVAMELWKLDVVQLYLLHNDNTETAAESTEDINEHNAFGGEFGFEKADATPEEE